VRHQDIDNAQITNFCEPNTYNRVKQNEFDITIEKPLNIAPAFDLYLAGTYKRILREGLIEFLPAADEAINHYEANAVISRFVGPDKVNFEFTYVYQDIGRDDLSNDLFRRERAILAGKFSYQLFRRTLQEVHERRFETRGIDFFGGAVRDHETFGDVGVERNDFFAGVALNGIGRFDFTVQPTIFTADVEGDKTRRNSQYRTNATVLFRIFDEEKRLEKGNPAFLHLVIPIKHDVAIDGLEAFENFKAGISLNTKFFTRGSRRTSFLASLSYDFQRFYRFNKSQSLFGLSISAGF
jgi:hypothetical protein